MPRSGTSLAEQIISAHDKVYGTNIKQGVILLCTKDLMFQRFIVDSERLKDCQQRFLEKVEQYYSMKLNS